MCTVTVYRSESEILATMNRDEVLTRAAESAPRIHDASGASWLAPDDGEKGGTWMGANSSGVVACLLNAYLPGESLLPDTSGKFKSRGGIIPGLLEHGPVSEGLTWLIEEVDLEAYPSFTLLVFAPGVGKCFEWLRRGKPELEELDDAWLIRSSAGWDSREVREWREERFARWLDSGERMHGTLPSFHVMQDPDHLEWSPLMKRSWSATRSVTQAHVRLEAGVVDMRYWPEPGPESREPASMLSLELETRAEPSLDAQAT